ncbi:galactose-1-phosphate uridylyltransferase [Aphanothece sacrum]|uniref:Galactose-1-phosphate uridylyltransferase n=1 Tax=Aphanothece sacrum FPU1 TaxID=1920663 RepID=A0A401ILI2_APHSA|nr:galactose-1-phosphate uridylyltransferase [Aphanothece sacrum]GBF82109.1 galactose-1-phosphate uridylyltransferase [Aphanothece sacrum FPU1]GBF85043.1 galactose-1-phosphate uridylyltransferase [Aphanothece sacrum FPU3]
MQSSQIRLNKATGEWVIYAPSRRKRPQDFQQACQEKSLVDHSQDTCPFCHQNNAHPEPSILEMFNSESTNWQTRVVSNKFPALNFYENPKRILEGIYMTIPGYGHHEVVIESPDHQLTIATMSVWEIEIIIETYRQRYLKLMADPKIMMVIIFRNHGQGAGASLRHPHSQIIATSIVPSHRRIQEAEAQRYFDHWAECVYCHILNFEIEEQKRIIVENDLFVAFVPFAAEVPFEIWIIPRHHQADFGSITPEEKTAFAMILKDVLSRLYNKLNNPDYNYVINTAARYKAEEPQLHWYCQIRPRLTTPAGFELGSGMSINPSIPEADAAFLRMNN